VWAISVAPWTEVIGSFDIRSEVDSNAVDVTQKCARRQQQSILYCRGDIWGEIAGPQNCEVKGFAQLDKFGCWAIFAKLYKIGRNLKRMCRRTLCRYFTSTTGVSNY